MSDVATGGGTLSRRRAQQPGLEAQADFFNDPDLNVILHRNSAPVASSSGAAIAPRSNTFPRTPSSSPTATRSDLSSLLHHRRQPSSSTLPTSPFPSASPHIKPTVNGQRSAERSSSRDSVRATVGSDTDSSSKSKQSKNTDGDGHIWNYIGGQFENSESESGQHRKQKGKGKGRRTYEVVVEQTESESQSPVVDLQVLLQRAEQSHRFQVAHITLTVALLILVLITFWTR